MSQKKFAPKKEIGLYGKKDCFGRDRYLIVKTSKEGHQVATSQSKGSTEDGTVDGLRTEGEVFMNKVYSLQYELQKGKGDDQYFTWLDEDFLPSSEDLKELFYGTPDTEYKIVFKLEGDYLVLYKASTNLNHIPYIERTSMVETSLDSAKHFMVPFIGYPLKYCNSRFQKTDEGKEKILKEKDCQNIKAEEAKYVYIDLSKGRDSYKSFKYDGKKDLFKADYFKGRWFYVEGPIETVSTTGEKVGDVVSRFTSLVRFEPKTNFLALEQITDESLSREEKDIQKTVKYHTRKIPVGWRDYKRDPDEFGEILINNHNPLASPYLTLGLSFMRLSSEVVDILVTPNYFSITFQEKSIGGRGGQPSAETKYQIAFLREEALDNDHFHKRKWFIKDSKHFGILFTSDDTYLSEEANRTQSENYKLWRMRRINLDKPGQNTVRFFFAKNSSTDKEYREKAKQAVQIYHQAFQNITQSSGRQITVELNETEEQDLGDLRHNVINIVYQGKRQKNYTYGRAPTYINPLTGQIIGGTVNIFVDDILDEAYGIVRDYIRYEVFQKHKDYSEYQANNRKYHVVNDYLRNQIQHKCEEVQTFIDDHIKLYNLKDKNGGIKPDTDLDDRDISIACGKRISEDQVLFVMLHEIGHIFGLAHNFEGSVDKENYYKSVAEIRNYFPSFHLAPLQTEADIIKTSSVMDYIPSLYAYPLTVLGKYDLEALRFLYMDQIRVKDSKKPVSLMTAQAPDEQKELDDILNQKKWDKEPYESCPDWQMSRFLCLRYDYGSTPKEMVGNAIELIKQAFNNHRYFYDIDPTSYEYANKFNNLPNTVRRHLRNIERLYQHYLKLKDIRFKRLFQEEKNKYSIHPPSDDDSESPHLQSIREYQDVIQPGEEDTEEYKDFFEMRNVVADFVKDFYFMENMKCKVEYKEESSSGSGLNSLWIDLNIIRGRLPNSMEETWYVEDCYSRDIEDFLDDYGLKVAGQNGIENFGHYYSEHYKDGKGKRLSVKLFPFNEILTTWFYLLSHTMQEVDIVDDLRETLEDSLVNGENLSNFDRELRAQMFFVSTTQKEKESTSTIDLVNTILFEQKSVRNLDVRKYTQGYFRPVFFPLLEGNQASFYQVMVRNIKAEAFNNAPRQVEYGFPFLTEHYLGQGYKDYRTQNFDDYKQRYLNLDNNELEAKIFQGYIFDLPSVAILLQDNVNREYLIMPFQVDSFYAKVIMRYNTNLEKIEELKKKAENEGLTFLEEIEKRDKEVYNLVLKQNFLIPIRRWM